MQYLGTQPLESERLLLRPFVVADAADMFRNWAGDSEVTKYLTWPPHADAEASRARIEFLQQEYGDPRTCDWAIVLKSLGQAIGSIGIVARSEETESVHIGYCIGRPWWQQGITSEAFSMVIRFLMEQAQVQRIDSRHDPRNPHSGMVMKKCGLTYEGTLRRSDWNNQGICDAAWYGLLREDYFKRKEAFHENADG